MLTIYKTTEHGLEQLEIHGKWRVGQSRGSDSRRNSATCEMGDRG